jgi:response regulator RpfG family c-di-GMP phosphodiesterase
MTDPRTHTGPPPSNNPCILFVDDEPNVLSAIQRQLRRDFNLILANSGVEATKLAETHKDIAAIVCDMRMPGMDGVATLEAFERSSPDTVRIMLTGNADQETAISAINRGKIFRFLNKPCGEDDLRRALQDALRQHQIVTAEKNLLNQTLTGSVRMLVDVLSLSVPEAFGRAARARHWVKPLAQHLKLTNRWEIEIAAMLAPIGLVAIPPEVLEKAFAGRKALTPAEQEMLDRAPEIGRKLIAHIPRLKSVSEFVYLQDRTFAGGGFPSDGPSGNDIPMGARIIKVLKDLAARCADDTPSTEAISRLIDRKNDYDPDVLDAVRQLWGWGVGSTAAAAKPESEKRSIDLNAMLPNDLLLSPITFKSGKLLLSPGVRVTTAQIERIRNLRTLEPIREPIEIERDRGVAMPGKASPERYF